MDTVEGVGDDLNGGGESEGSVRRHEIVVDGLGNADDLYAELFELEGSVERAITTDDHESVDTYLLKIRLGHLQDLVWDSSDSAGADLSAEPAAVGSFEDGSSDEADATDVIESKWSTGDGSKHAFPAALKTDELVSHWDAYLNDRGNDCVQPTTIATAR